MTPIRMMIIKGIDIERERRSKGRFDWPSTVCSLLFDPTQTDDWVPRSSDQAPTSDQSPRSTNQISDLVVPIVQVSGKAPSSSPAKPTDQSLRLFTLNRYIVLTNSDEKVLEKGSTPDHDTYYFGKALESFGQAFEIPPSVEMADSVEQTDVIARSQTEPAFSRVDTAAAYPREVTEGALRRSLVIAETKAYVAIESLNVLSLKSSQFQANVARTELKFLEL
ncbi:hypothetical protein LWI28_014926 [Acer negundo]|uniref:Uncharacterized protein n=1 Tax=Acer negundo TaxID=4023 RepID=A0AAD5JHY3_ACENE|nr:hypothetical protein LWI28_014926 [Acer negundo]